MTPEEAKSDPQPDDRVRPGDPYWEDGGDMPVGPDLVEDGYGRRMLPGLNYLAESLPGRGAVLSGWTIAYVAAYAAVVTGVFIMIGWIPLFGRLRLFAGGFVFAAGWIGLYVVQYLQNDAEHRIAAGAVEPFQAPDDEPKADA